MKLVGDLGDLSNIKYYPAIALLYFSLNALILYFVFIQYYGGYDSIFAIIGTPLISISILIWLAPWVERFLHKIELIAQVVIHSNTSRGYVLKKLIQAHMLEKNSTYVEVLSIELEQKQRSQDKLVVEFLTVKRYGFHKTGVNSHKLNTSDSFSDGCSFCYVSDASKKSTPIYESPEKGYGVYSYVCETCEENINKEIQKEITDDLMTQLVAQNI